MPSAIIVPVCCTPINKAEYQVSVKHTELYWVYLAPSDYITVVMSIFCDDMYRILSVIAPRGFQKKLAQTPDGRSFVSSEALCTVSGMYLVD